MNCTNGFFLEYSSRFFRKSLGSDYSFNKWELDLQYYKSLNPSHILAFQLIGKFSNGEVPYYQLSLLGGDKVMRGHYRDRYRDFNLTVVQTEYRWQFLKRFGTVLFGGIGDVSDDFNNFRIDELKYSFGTGIRYMVVPSQRINVRFDVGFGSDSYGVYLNIAEAF